MHRTVRQGIEQADLTLKWAWEALEELNIGTVRERLKEARETISEVEEQLRSDTQEFCKF